MTSLSSRLFHVFALLESMFSLAAYHYYTHSKQSYGGQWKYLTYINLNIKALYFLLCFLHDVVELLVEDNFTSAKHQLFQIKELLYTSVALPATFIVMFMFWSLYAIDRELVYPSYFDEIIPAWANHFWHTTIIIVVFDVATCHRVFPRNKTGFIIINTLSLLYICWVLWVEKVGGVIIYPILGKLNGLSFIAFLAVVQTVLQGIYFFGKFLNNITDKLFGFSSKKMARNKHK